MPQAGTALLPNGYGPLLSTTPSQILGVNSTRAGLFFYNPTAILVAVCPTSSGGLVPIVNGAGSMTLGQFGWLILDTAIVTSAWSGIAQSGGAVPLTIWEW